MSTPRPTARWRRSMGSRVAVAAVLALVCGGWPTADAGAQILIGPWVEEAEARAKRARTTDVRLIVLDADGGVAGNAAVSTTQLSHAVRLGVAAPRDPAALQRAIDAGLPLSAVTLDPPWNDPSAIVTPTPTPASLPERDAAWSTLVGPLLSPDLADWPESVARLEPAAVAEAMLARLERHAAAGRRVLAFGDRLRSPDAVADRLGPGFERQAMQRLRARRPGAALGLFYADALVGPGQRDMIADATRRRQTREPFDFIAVSYRDAQPLPTARLAMELGRLAAVEEPLVVGPVQAGGPTALEAATHAETLLRLLFAVEGVDAIHFAALTADQASEPHAALLDPDGEPSAVGRVVRRLFGELWRSDATHTSDAAGNVYTTLYHGVHRVTATMPDGSVATAEVRVDPSPVRRIFVVQGLQQ